MKVFQDLTEAIEEWQASRMLLIEIKGKLNCNESEIIGKIEQLKEARPVNDLNAINEQIDDLMDSLTDAMGRAEDTEQSVSNAQSEMEYVDSSDAVMGIQDVQDSFSDFRDKIKAELDGTKE